MVLSLDRWTGKVAVVTGASSGIGAAIAEQLVSKGIIVAGIARRVERVQELSSKLSNQKGKLHALKADVSHEEELLKAIKWVKENLGPIHILINNAGFAIHGNLTEGTSEDWRRVFDVNVLALCVATREVIKDMKNNHVDGHVIHINSILGYRVIDKPILNLNVLTATKFAVTALTETLRQELNHLGSKIKITNVSPGVVETEATSLNPKLSEEGKKAFAALAMLKAEDVADSVLYALSTPEHVQVHEVTVQAVGGI